jgi:hypothetical protein
MHLLENCDSSGLPKNGSIVNDEVAKILTLGQMRETDDKGRVVLRVGLVATWYFHDGYTLEKRQAVADCYDEYQESFGERLRWRVVQGGVFSGARGKRRNHRGYLLRPSFGGPKSKSWAFLFHGGELKEDASDFLIAGFGRSRLECEMDNCYISYLTIALPLSLLTSRTTDFPELILRWSRRLRPFHGYGGVGILTSVDSATAQWHRGSIYALAQRFPGLEVDDPGFNSFYIQESIKGGNWVTVLSDHWVGKLGGVEKMRQQLAGPQFRIDEYPGGVTILAGSTPELGDRELRTDTPNYRNLARLLKPIRATYHPGPGGFRQGQFEAWLARFDD